MKVKDVFNALARIAPVKTAESFDNVGLLVGDGAAEVTKAIVALDVTMEVAREAVEKGANLIVSHHPVFFDLKSVVEQDPKGALVRYLTKHDLSAICMHTNMDKARGGVNDALAAAVGIKDPKILIDGGVNEYGAEYGLCRYGELEEEMELGDFLARVKANLRPNGIRYNSCGKKVKRVAVGGGSCGDAIPYAAALGCDTFVSADLKYNMFLGAPDTGMNIIDAGHFPTENVVCPELLRIVEQAGVTAFISEKHREHVEYYL